jgi:hypothetical protein
MGYDCYLIDEEVIYDEFKLDEFLRRVFGWWGSAGGDSGGHGAGISTSNEQQQDEYADLLQQVLELESTINGG